jgi:hypothetical protein
MTPSDVLDCGDLLLWERHTHKTPTAKGLVARLVEGVMPDGKPCEATFEGYKPKDMIVAWHQFVKGEYDARTNRQEAAALKRAEAPRASSSRKDDTPVLLGGSEVATPQADKARQESVESILESKVADLSRSIARVETQIEATMGALHSLEAERDGLKKQRLKAVTAIRAMKETT